MEKGLEQEFFTRINNEIAEQFREEKSKHEAREELKRLSNIEDEDLLNKLLEKNINPTAMASLSLVPLVLVAWADGEVQAKERAAILRAVQEKGLDPFHPAYKLLDSWLEVTPGPKLFTTWKAYVQTLKNSLDDESYESLKKEILTRAHDVAEAAGGFLGFGRKISAEEKAELDRLGEAFEGTH